MTTTVTYQDSAGEVHSLDCDGAILIAVDRSGFSGLNVRTVINSLTYEEVARSFISAYVAAWSEFVEKLDPEASTVECLTSEEEELYPVHPCRCGSCGGTFYDSTEFDFCPLCGVKVNEVVEVDSFREGGGR